MAVVKVIAMLSDCLLDGCLLADFLIGDFPVGDFLIGDFFLADWGLPAVPFVQVMPYALATTVVLVLCGLVVVVSRKQTPAEAPSRGWLSKLIYVVFTLCVIVLAVTSFGAILTEGHMAGWPLLIHVGVAGAFVFLLVAMAWLFLPNGAKSDERGFTVDGRWWLSRWSAWALILSSLAAAATMFTSMLPILDTDGLLEFAELHRYAGLAVVLSSLVHLFGMLCSRLGWR